MFYNFCIATVSCEVLGGIAMEEKNVVKEYQEEIIKLIEKINNIKWLNYIYVYVKRFAE